MKKIPARPLLIDYGLAGMGLVLSRIDLGVSGSPFLVLRPPFLPLHGRKGAKEDQGVRDAGQVSRVPKLNK